MIKRNAGQGSRFKTAFVRHFFNFDIWEQTAFKKVGRIQSQIDRIRPAFRLTQGRKETFLPDSFKLMHILLSNYLVEVATLVSDDAEDDEDDAAEVEASDDAFFFALSRLSFSKSLLSTSGASVS